MKNDQQTIIDPILFAQLSKSMSGELSFSQFYRFGKLAKFDGEDVIYLLSFLYDEEKRCCIEGKSKVAVKLKCNRCLSLLPYEIEAIFRLYPVENHDINQLSKQLDVVIMKNGLISLVDIIEDELILSLPEVPMHVQGDPSCRSLLPEWSQEDSEQQENPFVVLKSLHRTNGK